jgi:hypothetical protein
MQAGLPIQDITDIRGSKDSPIYETPLPIIVCPDLTCCAQQYSLYGPMKAHLLTTITQFRDLPFK